jgi:3-dehydroquinate synthase
MAEFWIQERRFLAELDPDIAQISIRSVPRPYEVDLRHNDDPCATVADLLTGTSHPLLLVDRIVWKRWLINSQALVRVPRFELDAAEHNKSITSVLKVIDFLLAQNATKQTTLIVVGGGIVQDVAAFSCAMYKRGLPWIFAPTTLLAQGDSGVGAKASLNYGSTKNLLALFSAPRRVIIDTGFLSSLSKPDLMSGMGEIFRLHITGGPEFLAEYQKQFATLAGNGTKYRTLLAGALAVKRAVIEYDEFELDLRRALNYGHSFGHAFEALTDYRIPHGTAVTLGMLVENEIAHRRSVLSAADRDAMIVAARPILLESMVAELGRVRGDRLLGLLQHDKKTVGSTLKLAVPSRIGHIKFIDVGLDDEKSAAIWDCVRSVTRSL